MREWVCPLQLLLVLASAVILVSQSLGARDHILLSQIRDFPQRRGPGPHIYIPQEQGGPVYPQELGSFFVASYDSQGCDGLSLYRLRMDNIVKSLILVAYCCMRYPATSCLTRICLRWILIVEQLPNKGNPCYNILRSFLK
jgi:hypothetical protein